MIARSLLYFAFALSACGCAHNPFYDENRDKQAQDAQKAVTEAHVANAVAAMEEAFAAVAVSEETNAREYETYLFDLELKTVARASTLTSRFESPTNDGVDGLATVIRDRLVELGLLVPGETELPDDQIAEVWRTDSDIAEARDAAEVTFTEFHGTAGHKFASCAEVYAASTDPKVPTDEPSDRFLAALGSDAQRAIARLKFGAAIADCKKIDSAVKSHEDLYTGGLVKQLSDHVKMLEGEIAGYASAVSEARQSLDAAIAAFKAASPPPGKSSLAYLQEQADTLHGKLKKLTDDGGSAVSHVIAEEKLRRLEAILRAIAGTPGEGAVALNEDDKAAVGIVRALPLLKDEADKLFAEASKPRLVPFLAAIDQQKLVVQGFEARQKAKQKQLDAAQERLRAAYREGLAAARVMRPIIGNPLWANQSLKELDRLDSGGKAALQRALGIYADDVQHARVDGAVWEARERAAQFEESLVQSKFAAARWDGLMDTLAKVLADYHAAGIKRSDLAEFFKALGLVSIGVGVAQ